MAQDTIVCFPVHIKNDSDHTQRFASSFHTLVEGTSRGFFDPSTFPFQWYIDSNGSDDFTNRTLHSMQISHLVVNIVNEGGRHHALNRGLHYAKENGYRNMIVVNDDLFVDPLALESLRDGLSTTPIVGGLSSPTDLRNSTNQQIPKHHAAELYYVDERRNKNTPRFKGDLYGIRADYIDEYPPVYSDGQYLDLLYQSREGKNAPVITEAKAIRGMAVNWEGTVHRFQRHLEGMIQLREYCREHEPALLPFCRELPSLKEERQKYNSLKETNRAETPEAWDELIHIQALEALQQGDRIVEGSNWLREKEF